MRGSLNINFLLGAGTSPLPGTNKLTDKILQLSPPQHWNADEKQLFKEARPLFEFVKSFLERSFPNREWNYEDFYNIILHLCRPHDFLNAEVRPLLDLAIDHIFQGKNQTKEDVNKIEEQAEILKKYFLDVIGNELNKDFKDPANLPSYYEHFDKFLLNGHTLNIFTLNHDRSLDEYFYMKHAQVFTNGFVEGKDPMVRDWDPQSFDNKQKKIRLYKLHGSIEWQELSECGFFERIQPMGSDPTRIDDINLASRLSVSPLLLLGTFKKHEEYSTPFYMELFYRFMKALETIEVLIVSGYSFGDYRINQLLIKVNELRKNKFKLVLIYPPIPNKPHIWDDGFKPKNPIECKLKTIFSKLYEQGLLKIIERRFEDAIKDYTSLIDMCK